MCVPRRVIQRTVRAEPLLGLQALLAAVQEDPARGGAAQPGKVGRLAHLVLGALGVEALEDAPLVVEALRVGAVHEAVAVVVDLVVAKVLLGLEPLEAAGQVRSVGGGAAARRFRTGTRDGDSRRVRCGCQIMTIDATGYDTRHPTNK